MTPQEYTNTRLAMKHVMEGDGVIEGVLVFDAFKQLLTENLVRCPIISEDEINDKSKGDALSKGIALMQLTWFIVQIFARAGQGLAITELELTTAALAGLNSVMYFFWWSKPRDVRFPVVILSKGMEELLLANQAGDTPCTFPDSEFCFGEYLREAMTKSIRRKSDAIGSFMMSLPRRVASAPLQIIDKLKYIPSRVARLVSRSQSDAVSRDASFPKINALEYSNRIPMNSEEPFEKREVCIAHPHEVVSLILNQ